MHPGQNNTQGINSQLAGGNYSVQNQSRLRAGPLLRAILKRAHKKFKGHGPALFLTTFRDAAPLGPVIRLIGRVFARRFRDSSGRICSEAQWAPLMGHKWCSHLRFVAPSHRLCTLWQKDIESITSSAPYVYMCAGHMKNVHTRICMCQVPDLCVCGWHNLFVRQALHRSVFLVSFCFRGSRMKIFSVTRGSSSDHIRLSTLCFQHVAVLAHLDFPQFNIMLLRQLETRPQQKYWLIMEKRGGCWWDFWASNFYKYDCIYSKWSYL